MPIQTDAGLSVEWLIAVGFSLLIALIAIGVGWKLSGWLSRHATVSLPKTGYVDVTVANLISQIIRYGILLVTLIVVLGQFGVETTSILAVLGAAGLAIALALQGTLSNIAAGVMIIWLRPFSIGEAINYQGTAGAVVEIGLFHTRLRTYDGLFIFIPNAKLWDSHLTNYNREPTRMVELKIGVSYESDLAKVRATLLATAQDKRILAEPAPTVYVDALDASSVRIGFRVWVAQADWWGTKIDLQERTKLALDAAGIEIPYQKIDVRNLVQPQATPQNPPNEVR